MTPAMPNIAALAACPFCGGTRAYITDNDAATAIHVNCRDCGASLYGYKRHFGSVEEAIAAWNRRAVPEGQASAGQEGVTEGTPRNWRTILTESEANFNRQFGIRVAAAWVYRDLEDMFASLHDKRCPAALNLSDPCNCGATS